MAWPVTKLMAVFRSCQARMADLATGYLRGLPSHTYIHTGVLGLRPALRPGCQGSPTAGMHCVGCFQTSLPQYHSGNLKDGKQIARKQL